jgi:hypothetical protein
MATKTLGTNANNTLTAVQWQPGMTPADLATINALIAPDITGQFDLNSWFEAAGFLNLPGGRGRIALQPGDWIGVDGAGWPVVVSNSIIATSWTHS